MGVKEIENSMIESNCEVQCSFCEIKSEILYFQKSYWITNKENKRNYKFVTSIKINE